MKRIYLFCSAGMSTSMLAQKMQEVGDAHQLPVEVKAFSHAKIQDIVDELHPDCILLGPQIAYLESKIKDRVNGKVPVESISALDFGRMNTLAILKQAIRLLKNK